MTNETIAQQEPKSQPRPVAPPLSEGALGAMRDGIVRATDQLGEALATAVEEEAAQIVRDKIASAMLELWRVRWELDLHAGDVVHAARHDATGGAA